jgi:hypothetical protein
MHLENNLSCLYNLVHQVEFFILFVKLILKLLILKINQNLHLSIIFEKTFEIITIFIYLFVTIII